MSVPSYIPAALRPQIQRFLDFGARAEWPDPFQADDGFRSAVLVLLVPDDRGENLDVVLTVRTTKLRRNAGEVALAGGRFDAADKTLTVTALRECEEEIGVPASAVTVLCTLPVFISRTSPKTLADGVPSKYTNLLMTPVVGVMSPAAWNGIKPNPDEVAAVFRVPLGFFMESSKEHSALIYRWPEHRDIVAITHTFRTGTVPAKDIVWAEPAPEVKKLTPVVGVTTNIVVVAAELGLGARSGIRKAVGKVTIDTLPKSKEKDSSLPPMVERLLQGFYAGGMTEERKADMMARLTGHWKRKAGATLGEERGLNVPQLLESNL
ncbi:hypothetical protein DFJ74DRAFT_646115 [Hyaloraphidium curvatum]|nr:hypothetical protein DFJ74DRAFT_646115 [Hyaloraphidium curvatum]